MVVPQLPELDVFFGDLTVNRAYVYARLPRPAADAGLSLAGQVRGPRCLHAETLPLTSPLADLGPGPTLLARALVPDPVFWSPDLPAIYDVTVHLMAGNEILATERRELGLRWLGLRGGNLALESKRWVLRGVMTGSTVARLPREWHGAAAVLVASKAADDQLAEAAQWGALTAVEVHERGEPAVRRLRQLAQFPGVFLAVVQGTLPADFKPSQVAPNVLLAEPVDPTAPHGLAPWAELAWVAADNLQAFANATRTLEIPVVAVRPLAQPLPIDEARRACDTLQRDLASLGQFAGYVV